MEIQTKEGLNCFNLRQLGTYYIYYYLLLLYLIKEKQDIPGPEGHLVLKLENEVGPPLRIQKTTLILTKIGVFD